MYLGKRLISLISSVLIASLIFTGCGSNLSQSVLSKGILTKEQKIYEEPGSNAEELNIEAIMNELTSEEYLSRLVGTDANTKSAQFIQNYYEAIGLEPFNDESYLEVVDLNNEMRSFFNPAGDNKNEVDNIIGVIKGEDSSKAIVISAHFDHVTIRSKLEEAATNTESQQISVNKIQGAIDNASGVATLLETAKELSAYYNDNKPPYDIIFAAFNAEELGLIGSRKFVSEFRDKYDKWYDINIDCIGIKGNNGLAVKNNDPLSQELYDDFIEVLDENEVYYEIVPYAMNEEGVIVGSSDHMSFRRANDASLIIGQDGITEIVHTEDDNMSIVDCKLIENIKDALVDFIIKNDNKIY